MRRAMRETRPACRRGRRLHRRSAGAYVWLLAAALVALSGTVAAADECASSCRTRVTACRRSECAGKRGAERRDCAERCRGKVGCPARIRTLAYVVTRCQSRGHTLTGGQQLMIRRGNCEPVTALRLEIPGEAADPLDLCKLVGRNREGYGSVVAGVFQRLGVTPDGSGVVFEVTNDQQLISHTPLTEEQKGFFYVRADGTGLRWLAHPSREPTYRGGVTPVNELTAGFQTYLPFSPSGRL